MQGYWVLGDWPGEGVLLHGRFLGECHGSRCRPSLYECLGVRHSYVPDFLVRLGPGLTLVMEIKGYEDEQDRAKHQAAKRWVSAVRGLGSNFDF